MRRCRTLLLLLATLGLAAWGPLVAAQKRTVCTITVNSPDERDAFRRALPESQYEFVELVERGRPDWLASACRRGVRCDVLVVSGHFNGNDFFSDQLTVDEYLPVEEMERASCSGSCPGLFSGLKEVYLFGCTSLSPDVTQATAGEVARTLVQSGRAHGEATRLAAALEERHGQSNRDVMRRVFPAVPAIYGFSAVAPLGQTAGPILQRYFQSGGAPLIGSGRTNRRLLSAFSVHGMTVAHGVRPGEPDARYRADVCRFVDEREDHASRLRFVHEILKRNVTEMRFFLDRIERFLAALPAGERDDPAFQAALKDIAADTAARAAFLGYARDAVQPGVRARMIDVAQRLNWLSEAGARDEVAALVRDLLARPAIRTGDIGLACRLAARYPLGDAAPAASLGRSDQAAVLACLGQPAAHAQLVSALSTGVPADADAVEMYVQHRAFTPDEIRTAIADIGEMHDPAAQARALDILARHGITGIDALTALVNLYPLASTPAVQRAIAGILIRSDYRALASTQVIAMLRAFRLPERNGNAMVDILIRRLEDAAIESQAAAAGRERG